MMRNRKNLKISYEPEADVLRIEIREGNFYNTIELGNFIIHLNEKSEPIYMEILGAKDFLLRSNQVVISRLLYQKV